MGYNTDFCGSLEFNKPVEGWLVNYIDRFNETRRMKRDVEKIKELYPDWEEKCFKGNLGPDGAFFVGGDGFMGQLKDDSILDYNCPPSGQPGLWCQWIVNNGGLMWDGNEKFYNYVSWLKYLIENFFSPLGYVLNGAIDFQGEDSEDFGTIVVNNNVVTVEYGIRLTSMSDLKTEDLITELENRGHKVTT